MFNSARCTTMDDATVRAQPFDFRLRELYKSIRGIELRKLMDVVQLSGATIPDELLQEVSQSEEQRGIVESSEGPAVGEKDVQQLPQVPNDSQRVMRALVTLLPRETRWGIVRLSLNQLTTQNVDHLSGRTDFPLVPAFYPIRVDWDLQQSIVSYCLSFPLPTTNRETAQRFVSVFVDLLVAFGADWSFVFEILLLFACPDALQSESLTRQGEAFPLTASLLFLQDLEPLIDWSCFDFERAKRAVTQIRGSEWNWFEDCVVHVNAARTRVGVTADDVRRNAWMMIAELSVHGEPRSVLLLQAIARHPQLCSKPQQVWTQFLASLLMTQQITNRRATTRSEVSRAAAAAPTRGDKKKNPPPRHGTAAAASATAHCRADVDTDRPVVVQFDLDLGLLFSVEESSAPPPTDVEADMEQCPEAEGLTEDGLLTDSRPSHRVILYSIEHHFEPRVGLTQRTGDSWDPVMGNITNSAVAHADGKARVVTLADDRFLAHDYEIMCILLRKLPFDVVQFIVDEYVVRAPKSMREWSLINTYDRYAPGSSGKQFSRKEALKRLLL